MFSFTYFQQSHFFFDILLLNIVIITSLFPDRDKFFSQTSRKLKLLTMHCLNTAATCWISAKVLVDNDATLWVILVRISLLLSKCGSSNDEPWASESWDIIANIRKNRNDKICVGFENPSNKKVSAEISSTAFIVRSFPQLGNYIWALKQTCVKTLSRSFLQRFSKPCYAHVYTCSPSYTDEE